MEGTIHAITRLLRNNIKYKGGIRNKRAPKVRRENNILESHMANVYNTENHLQLKHDIPQYYIEGRACGKWKREKSRELSVVPAAFQDRKYQEYLFERREGEKKC